MSPGKPFKICPCCHEKWPERADFLSDKQIILTGYQAHFIELTAGFFLFNHHCGTTIAIEVGEFRDLYTGPVFEENLSGTNHCRGHCLHESDLNPCPARCECAFVRQILQTVRNWPKRY